ncbi:MAG: hypothetical protein A3F26_02020 [Candidatus Ryanbacteria bacterium RIFCSPHIGHO2_12_FULL_47_12b]|uniref:DUF2339 domain-containing protein n=3 Tax=Parcubacteria group TaxID=1794811 RepID=A0A1G2H4Z3_9BACT|nr:MAG: hypothetical protein UX74_C0024G0007 [Parcubacteria group bacterium GW2011_GWA2_47_10b]KKU76031.1 MAG: hypothetical protein UY02_C0035G0006 [Candidatus Giovannonibacteria bacterium GW2011_GWB1_47_6b]OGZ45061.1 MAG: hypothetical protein A2844_02660 [Candidatus Ryanbacteria bacterium RIFCSPHIGHO2_01_FULL_48_80]OGZ48752.1 MAG: hypothetical protein A3C83_00655 [Candidatus Ryanbacteria bacterium RIFCSPHIGHO2_02_FULL_47_25]OGZ52250.1 MAG: hypothetical protein A3A29_00510 [Candidatus Ryanbacte
MSEEIQDIKQRLERIEKALGIVEAEKPYLFERIPAPPTATGEIPPPPPPTAGSEVKSTFFSRGAEDFESYIGQRWLAVVGIVAVIIGASFFLKYAFDNNLIGETGRVILGLLGGLVFVGLGEYFSKKYEKYSWVLSGGGIALFYLSIFAAFAYYDLIAQLPAFAFMIVVTVFGGGLAIRYSAFPLAVVAVTGGFLTPFLLSTPVDNQIGLFTYLAILNFGILLIATFRNWRALNLIGLIGTFISFGSWFGFHYNDSKLFLTELYLIVFFAEYLFATILGNLFSEAESRADDLGLLTLNAAWFYGWSYGLLRADYEPYLGVFTALMAALYIFLAYIALTAKAKDRSLGLFLGAIALIFLTLVFPVQFSDHWITIAWAVEAVILTFVGFSLGREEIRYGALFVLAIALMRLFALDTNIRSIVDHTILFNVRVMTYVVVIASAVVMQGLYMRGTPSSGEKNAVVALGALWNILLLAILSLEVSAFFEKKIALLREAAVSKGENWYNVYDTGEYRRLLNQGNVSLSVLWALYASLALVVGMIRKSKSARWGALILFGITLVKVFFVDLASLPTVYRFISFMVLGVLLLAGSYLYYRNQKRLSS